MPYLVCDSPASGTHSGLREAPAKWYDLEVDSDLAVCMQGVYWDVFSSLMAVGEVKEEGPGRDLCQCYSEFWSLDNNPAVVLNWGRGFRLFYSLR